MARKPAFRWHPLTPDRWGDLESLFGPRGACGGCWCMVWRLARSQFDKQKGDLNRAALKALVDGGPPPGILGYLGNDVVGWCAVAPREAYPALDRSRLFKPLDDEPVWSISCLFVDKSQRRTGLSVRLLKAAVEFVKQQGGRIVEGYPVEPKSDNMPVVFAWTGMASAFVKAGFKECARPSATRPIMRRRIGHAH